MTYGDIVEQDGRYFRVLKPGEARLDTDYLEWMDGRREMPGRLDLDVRVLARNNLLVAEGDSCFKLREIDPLIGAMLIARKKANGKSTT